MKIRSTRLFPILLSVLFLSLVAVAFYFINRDTNRKLLEGYRSFIYTLLEGVGDVIHENMFSDDVLYEEALKSPNPDLDRIEEEFRTLSPLFSKPAICRDNVYFTPGDYFIKAEGTRLFYCFRISNSAGEICPVDFHVRVEYDIKSLLGGIRMLDSFLLTTDRNSYQLAYGLRVVPKTRHMTLSQSVIAFMLSFLFYLFYRRISNQFHTYFYNSEGLEKIIYLFEKTEEYSANHSRNVGEISHYLGKKLGLRRKRLKDLKVAAFLHDIGKISIPVEILNKTGALSVDEFGEVKKHVNISAEIIENFEGLRHLKEIILYHHEKMDGSGYPRGLMGYQIPLESRIIAVADIFEALVGERPYRSSVDKYDALDIMGGMPLDKAVLAVLAGNLQEICRLITYKKGMLRRQAMII